jgi:hypothetical protein
MGPMAPLALRLTPLPVGQSSRSAAFSAIENINARPQNINYRVRLGLDKLMYMKTSLLLGASSLWSRILITLGTVAMLAGALDPLEGSLVILPGAGLITLGTFLGHTERQLRTQWVLVLLLIAFGVGALWGLSALDLYRGHSRWWQILILPYPIGWVIGIVNLLFRLVRSIQHSQPA